MMGHAAGGDEVVLAEGAYDSLLTVEAGIAVLK